MGTFGIELCELLDSETRLTSRFHKIASNVLGNILRQWYLNIKVHMNHLGVLLKWGFCFRIGEVGLRFCFFKERESVCAEGEGEVDSLLSIVPDTGHYEIRT